MAQNNARAWSSTDDRVFISLIIILVGGAFFCWLAWVNYHSAISLCVANAIHWQIRLLIQPFSSGLDDLNQMVQTADTSTVTVPQILSVLGLLGSYLRIPAVAIIVVLAGLCIWRAAPSQFTKKLDLDGLIREQAPFFPYIAAHVNRHLKLTSLDRRPLRPADPALDAIEWVARLASGPKGEFDEAAATRAFALQLGPEWRGLESAPGHARVLYAAFALHLAQRRAEAQALLGAMAKAIPNGDTGNGLGPAEPYALPNALIVQADTVLEARDLRDLADPIAGRHAYTAPALMSLLTEARRRAGVLAPAHFACLKLIDRGLWYALHSLGFEGDGPGQNSHPTPRIEAAGARDHWAAERVAGRPLAIPSVSRATDAVRAALTQNGATTKV